MNEEIIKNTQDSLGKIIGKKPPLTEKLLSRPPFKFLHDIITSVIRQTGFMKGLYTDKELASENVSAKEDKVAFLQKAIDIAAYATGIKLSARPSKIVAGLEAEKTNEFLQALAAAVEKKVDNEACVKKVLGNGGGDEPSAKREHKSKDKDRDRDREKESAKENDRERSADRRKRRSDKEKGEPSKKSSSTPKEKDERKDRGDRDRDRDGRKHRDSSKDGRRESSKTRESSRNRESSRDHKDKDSSNPQDDKNEEKRDTKRDERREERREKSGRHRRKEEESAPQTEEAADESQKPDADGNDEEQSANKIPRPASAKGSRRRHREGRRQAPDDLEDDDGQSDKKGSSANQDEDPAVPPQVEQVRRLARPSSARPAPPRVKRQDNVQDSLNERVDSARTQRVENVIIDNAQQSGDEDDDHFMVEDGAQDPSIPDREETVAPPSEEDGQHGGLVKKILESKKEYDQSEQQKSQTKTRIDKSSVNDATRHKEKEMVRKEVDKLRASIQTLTRSANPLGKIMDYVQEDLHSMQKERDTWRAENKTLSEQIKKEMGVTDGSIEPLKVTLAELEQAVSDQLDLIAAVKHSIIENDEKITKMLSSVSKS